MVVREAVGQDHEDSVAKFPFALEDCRAVPDGRAEPRVGASNDAPQAPQHGCVERLVEALHRQHLDRHPSLRTEAIQGDPVTEVVKRADDAGSSFSLVLVHCAARRGGLAGRARDVEQHEHRQVAPAPDAVDVDRVVGRNSGGDLDPGFDGSVNVDVVALQLPVASLELRTESRERTRRALRPARRAQSRVPARPHAR